MKRTLLWILVSGCFVGGYGAQQYFKAKPLPEASSPSSLATASSPSPSVSYNNEIFEKRLNVKPGQTLARILTDAGIEQSQTHAVIEALGNRFDPKELRPGQEIFIRCKIGDQQSTNLLRLLIRPCLEREIVVSRNEDGGYQAGVVHKKLVYEMKNSRGFISSSLYADAAKAGIPAQVINEVTQGLSYKVHLQRDLHEGAPFEVVYETAYDEESGKTKPGKLIYAAIGIQGEAVEIFHFQTEDGKADLYTQTGESVRRALLMTPVTAARLSSGFGMRRHPIKGFSRMHKGVDFAAPRGTPVMAAGDGKIVFAGRKGGYGNYIMLKHGNGYSTVYAHLSKFSQTIKNGGLVKQGQVIGFVGSTGMSTGPHLHHEVLINGKHVDPQKVKQPPHTKLTGKELKNFAKMMTKIRRHIRGLVFKNQLVMKDNTDAPPQS